MIALGHGRRFPSKGGGRNTHTRPQVLRSRIAVNNNRLTNANFADSHRSKEGCHAVVIRLAPAIEWMMMALGAGDADTKKHLRQSARRFAWLR